MRDKTMLEYGEFNIDISTLNRSRVSLKRYEILVSRQLILLSTIK